MKVLEKGTGQKGWSGKFRCTGNGNGGGGCGAVLLVEEPDLYRTSRTDMKAETDYFVTFTCIECGVETDIEDFPSHKERDLPNKKEWKDGLARSTPG